MQSATLTRRLFHLETILKRFVSRVNAKVTAYDTKVSNY